MSYLTLNVQDFSIRNENNQKIDKCLKYVNHSPDGFSWGYGGSGPSQAAFAILMYILGENELKFIKNVYQDFKFDIIAKLNMNESHILQYDEVFNWIENGKKLKEF